MKGKGSYRAKYQEKNPEQSAAPYRYINVSDETRIKFESGQVILIDKDIHWTSFDVVKKIRSILRIKKVGHAGTLDPLASGLLIICTGPFTKKINEYMAREKAYAGSFTLGAVTPTYDLESTPIDHKDISLVTEAAVREAATYFVGEIEQKPPVYSALKKAGIPLYELARSGQEVDVEPRKIIIHSFEITSVEWPVIKFSVVCSTGTYIRSLAHDMGIRLGCGAYLSELRRTGIGSFRVEEAARLDTFFSSIDTAEIKTDS